MPKPNIYSTLLKEPLVHFLLIGAGLFLLFAQLNNNKAEDESQKILINNARVSLLSSTFIAANSKQATSKEMALLLKNDIREEILYHEAIKMGLDKDDRIIRHRLAEKMKYIFEDVAMLEDPDDEKLFQYMELNSQKYNKPFNEIKMQLKSDWMAKEQENENEAFYQNLKNEYQLVIDKNISNELNINIIK
jgi:hypothetical protein